MKFYLPLFLVIALASGNQLYAADPQKQQQLQRDIRQLSSALKSQQGESRALQDEVTQLEKKLGDISDKYYQTEKKAEATQAKLEESGRKQHKLDAELDTQKSGLAQQLQALYTAGEQSPLRLLLRQDDPSDISRTIRYFEYLNDSRVNRIQGIQKTLKEIQSVRLSIVKDSADLQQLNQTLEQQKKDIQQTLTARSTVLGNIKSDIRSKEKQLGKLKTEEANLQAVIDRLARKAEAQAAEKLAQAQAKPEAPQKTVTQARQKTSPTVAHPSKPASRPTRHFPPCGANYPGRFRAESSTATGHLVMKNNAGAV